MLIAPITNVKTRRPIVAKEPVFLKDFREFEGGNNLTAVKYGPLAESCSIVSLSGKRKENSSLRRTSE